MRMSEEVPAHAIHLNALAGEQLRPLVPMIEQPDLAARSLQKSGKETAIAPGPTMEKRDRGGISPRRTRKSSYHCPFRVHPRFKILTLLFPAGDFGDSAVGAARG